MTISADHTQAAWTIGHDGGGGSYAWAWPNGYAHCYANPSGGEYFYPNNLHVYMERRNVTLVGYGNPRLSFSYMVNTEPTWDYFTVNIRDQGGNWHELFRRSGANSSHTWSNTQLDLSAYAGQNGLYIQFRFDSNGSVPGDPYWGAYVDNVTLTADPTPSLVDAECYVSPTTTAPGGQDHSLLSDL